MKRQTQGTSYNIAASAVQITEFGDSPIALLAYYGGSDGSLALITVSAGAAVLGVGTALITVTKDNAATVNIYVENDVVKIQNLTAATINIFIKNL